MLTDIERMEFDEAPGSQHVIGMRAGLMALQAEG